MRKKQDSEYFIGVYFLQDKPKGKEPKSLLERRKWKGLNVRAGAKETAKKQKICNTSGSLLRQKKKR